MAEFFDSKTIFIFLFLWSFVILSIGAAVFGRGISHSGNFLNDIFVFFDGIDAMSSGLLPNQDILSPIGPLAYYLPYLGYRIVGEYSGSIEMASLLLAAPVLLACATLLCKNTSPSVAMFLMGVIAAVIIVPLPPGFDPANMTPAMHYNRWGWGILSAVMLLGLPPSAERGWIIRASLCVGAFLTCLFLIKITFFLVGLGFLALLFFVRDTRRLAAFGSIFVCVALIGLFALFFPGVFSGYLIGLDEARHTNNAVRGSYLIVAYADRTGIYFFLIAAYIAVFGLFASLLELALAAYILISGIAIIDQNYQFQFLVTLTVGFVILANGRPHADKRDQVLKSAIMLCAIFALVPYLSDLARVTLVYAQPPAPNAAIIQSPKFDHLFIDDNKMTKSGELKKRSGQIDVGALLRGEVDVQTSSQREYAEALVEAAELVKSVGAEQSEILTLDFTNAVPVVVDAKRTKGGHSWYHFGRNVSGDTLPKNSDMFSKIDYVIIPVATVTKESADILIAHYGDYLAKHSTEAAQSDNWVLLKMED